MPANRVSPKQIEDWTENPSTIAALKEAKVKLERLLNDPVLDYLCHGNPQVTQEKLVRKDEEGRMWLVLMQVLSGDWSIFEELEDDSE